MGTYIDESDVQGEFKTITFSTSTVPTLVNVLVFIAQEEAAIELAVAAVYTVPITSTRGIALMALMATCMVKARILDVQEVKAAGTLPNQSTDMAQKLRDRVSNEQKTGYLDKLLAGTLNLEDDLSTSSGGVSSYTQANDIEPVFEKETKQW